MATVAGRVRVNRPYFFTDVDGARVEFPAFGEGQGDLEGAQLREFNTYIAAKQIETIEPTEPATVPAAFEAGDWTAEPAVGAASIEILNMPDDGGSPITGITISSGGETLELGPDDRDGLLPLEDGTHTVQIAASNAVGQAVWSDSKTVIIETEE